MAAKTFDDGVLMPIAVIDGGKLKAAAEDQDPAVLGKFADAFYRKGTKYRLLFGGGEAGSVTVNGDGRDGECGKSFGKATLSAPAVPFSDNVRALVTSSFTLGQGTGTRRAPTAVERAEAVRLATESFTVRKFAAPLVQALEVINLTAIDVSASQKAVLVGSFVVTTKTGVQSRDTYFLIAEQQPNGRYNNAFASLTHTAADALMEGADMDDVASGRIETEMLIDQLDIDGDGVNEIFTVTASFEGQHFRIYKSAKDRWQQIFKSYVYVCAF